MLYLVFPWLLWGETWQHQASEREGSPKTMPSDAKEVYVSKTRGVKQSGRRDEARSEQRKLGELKESIKNVREMDQVVTRLKSNVCEFKLWLSITF